MSATKPGSPQTLARSTAPAMEVQLSTNGVDADTEPGLLIEAGDAVAFTYVVTNSGNAAISQVTLVDDNGTPNDPSDDFNPRFIGGDADADGLLDLTESWTFDAPNQSRNVTAGPFTSEATVSGIPVDDNGNQIGTASVSASDPSSHLGLPIFFTEFLIDGSNTPVGVSETTNFDGLPDVIAGGNLRVSERVHVINESEQYVEVSFDAVSGTLAGDVNANWFANYLPSAASQFEVTEGYFVFRDGSTAVESSAGAPVAHPFDASVGTINRLGSTRPFSYQTRLGIFSSPFPSVFSGTATDVNSVTGVTLLYRLSLGSPAVSLNTLTNGRDADSGNGEYLPLGTNVNLTYEVTNTGDVELDDVSVRDDRGTPGDAGDDFAAIFVSGDSNNNGFLSPGEIWVYAAPAGSTVVAAGQFTNQATVTANPVDAFGVDHRSLVDRAASDPSNHFGVAPQVQINTSTNGSDSDIGPGQTILVGDVANFTYEVTNTGNVELASLVVRDDNGTPGDVGDDFDAVFSSGDLDGDGRLDPSETFVFAASRLVTEGPFTNIATVTGTPVDPAGSSIAGVSAPSASDPSNHTGLVARDYGDAPDSYSTTAASGGPSHRIIADLLLGSVVDEEPDGFPSVDADGDDADGRFSPSGGLIDDEDSFRMLSPLIPGVTSSIEISTNNATSQSAFLQAWIDFNLDGDFADAGEQVVTDRIFATGTHTIPISVPASAGSGDSFIRFRYSLTPGLSFQGDADSGEIEDHAITIGAPRSGSIRGVKFSDSNGNGVRESELRGSDPHVVFVVDISGSTSSPFQGTPVGDPNGDALANTIIDAEIAAFEVLYNRVLGGLQNGTFQSAAVSIVAFDNFGRTVVDSAVLPDPNVISTLRTLQSSGGTEFDAALQETLEVLTNANVASENANVIFLSDGFPFSTDFTQEVVALQSYDGGGVNLRAFGVGRGSSLDALSLIDRDAVIFDDTDSLTGVFQGTNPISLSEPGLAGVTIFLDLNRNGTLDAGEPNTVTAADGGYRFSGLAPGEYVVAEVLPSGFVQTAPAGGVHTVVVTSGSDVADVDFGNLARGSVSGRKFSDLNRNGVQDPGEPGLQGFVIFIDSNENGQLDPGERSTVTGTDGEYRIDDLDAGRYVIAEVQQAGFIQTAPEIERLAPVSVPSESVYLTSLIDGDFNDDSITDLASSDWFSGNVSVFLGNGDATFNESVVSVGHRPRKIAVFESDGLSHLAVIVSDSGQDELVFLENQGDGRFELSSQSIAVGNAAVDLAVGDFNQDGLRDIVLTDVRADELILLTHQGGFRFDSARIPVGLDPVDVDAFDIDGDQDLDLVVANALSDDVTVLWNDGRGSFAVTQTLPAGDEPSSVGVGDVDNDGRPDLVVANYLANTVSLYSDLNAASAASVPQQFFVGNRPKDLTIGDFDGDGFVELAVANSEASQFAIVDHDPGAAREVRFHDAGGGASSILSSDFDADALADFALATFQPSPATDPGSRISIILNSRQVHEINLVTGQFAQNLDFGNHALPVQQPAGQLVGQQLGLANVLSANAFDVSGDGVVTPLDALAVINGIQRQMPETEPWLNRYADRRDVNGDGRVSVFDALLVINHLALANDESSGEGERNPRESGDRGSAFLEISHEDEQSLISTLASDVAEQWERLF